MHKGLRYFSSGILQLSVINNATAVFFNTYAGVHIKLYVHCHISKNLEFKITQRVAAAAVLLIL